MTDSLTLSISLERGRNFNILGDWDCDGDCHLHGLLSSLEDEGACPSVMGEHSLSSSIYYDTIRLSTTTYSFFPLLYNGWTMAYSCTVGLVEVDGREESSVQSISNPIYILRTVLHSFGWRSTMMAGLIGIRIVCSESRHTSSTVRMECCQPTMVPVFISTKTLV
jgi:hypothetical protein